MFSINFSSTFIDIYVCYRPLIEEICQKPNIYTHYGLQICAVQALSRAMMLSQQYCNSKIRVSIAQL